MLYPLLESINTPTDLKQLEEEQLPLLCEEIRGFLLDTLSRNPGHLGAGLGVVELTVALHYVFNTPTDKLVWDVGHQAYPHKLLTERRQSFETLRHWNGLSGFPSPSESHYDSFVAGHASNSISAALGMAVANKLKGKEDKVVAIIGDGSMSGGLAYEGINNASNSPNDLLIVLNDNNMSIDPVTGGLSRYLVNILTSKTYNKVRHDAYKKLKHLKLIDETKKRKLTRFNTSLKSLFTENTNFFEGFSLRYFGPVDGHDVNHLVKILRDIKDFKGPKLLHIRTIKGKGYKPAEDSQVRWHAPGKFDKESGQIITYTPEQPEPPKFQDVFGETLLELASEDERVIGVTPAMPTGCSMTIMQKVFPERVFDVGIAEGHAVTFSAGLAVSGMKPFCNVYSTFLQRGYDNVIHDAAMQKAPVVFCLDRAGLVGEDGMTHQGVFDIAYLRCIPQLTLCSPYDEQELRRLMFTAYRKVSEIGPMVIRYPRGKGFRTDWRVPLEEVPVGKGRCLTKGTEVAVLSYGPMGNYAACAVAAMQNRGLRPSHYDLRFVKPLDEELLEDVFQQHKAVLTVEDGCLEGGVYSAVLEWMHRTAGKAASVLVKGIGVPDHFVPHGDPDSQRRSCGMDTVSIENTLIDLYQQLGRVVGDKNTDHIK